MCQDRIAQPQVESRLLGQRWSKENRGGGPWGWKCQWLVPECQLWEEGKVLRFWVQFDGRAGHIGWKISYEDFKR